MDLKLIENEMIPIYEDTTQSKLVNARELHELLKSKRKFADWIKQRIEQYKFAENEDFFRFHKFVKGDEKGYGNKTIIEYYLTIDTAKEIAMIENNDTGRQIRKYFIEVEKRYQNIVSNPANIFDFMRLALDQIEANEDRLNKVQTLSESTAKEVEEIKQKIDVIIKSDYCLASDIAEQLGVYSESNLPHSNFVGAIARQLGYKNTYKHYYEDKYIAIVTDLSKGNDFWQVFYKPKAVKEIIDWFNTNKDEIEYKILYEKNCKNGTKGEIREHGYEIDKICYKVVVKEN